MRGILSFWDSPLETISKFRIFEDNDLTCVHSCSLHDPPMLAQSDAERCSALSHLAIPDVEITSATFSPGPGPQERRRDSPTALPSARRYRQARWFRWQTFAIGFELRCPRTGRGDSCSRAAAGWMERCGPRWGRRPAPTRIPHLPRGFAVVSTDAGHTGAPPLPEADASFARDQQARIDNAYRSIDRVTQIAKQIVMRYYGRTWRYAYFDGCSNGGRQGLMAAQRFPLYFDGIVSGAPAFRVTHAGIGSAWETLAFLKIAPKDDAGHPILSRAFSDADLKLVANGVLKTCDALDGLADGLVMNPSACHFSPGSLMCAGAKQPTCLSREQVTALERVMGGPKDSRGEAIYSDWPWDPGMASPGWRQLKLGTSTTAQPNSIDVLLMLPGLRATSCILTMLPSIR